MWFTLAQIPKPPKMPKVPAEIAAWKKAWQQLSSNQYFTIILYVIGILAILWLCRFLWRRLRKNAPAAPAVTLTAKELLICWAGFLKAIPRDFRRTIAYYKPFVVMGGGSTGKSQLIDKYTDWKGMARQFYPSYNSNSKLQFHLGTQSLIQELSLPILEDSSKSARRALKKLWKKTFSKSEPTIILTVPVDKLDTSSAEILKKQAQLLRGKINVIAWQRKSTVKTRIALTHMDSVEGYAEFCKLLTDNKINFKLNLKDYSTDSLSKALEPYEKYLSLALTTMSSSDYLKIVAFFQEAPKQLARLQTFIKALCITEPLSPEPELLDLLLTSNLEHDHISSPFEVSAVDCIVNRWNFHWHRIAALITFGFLFGYGTLGYYLEKRRLDSIEAHLNEFELRLQQQDDVKIRILDERFHNLNIKEDWKETVLFPEELKQEKDHLVNNLRPFLERERAMLDDFPELDFFPPFFRAREAYLHELLDKDADHLEVDIQKTNKLLSALEVKQKEWKEYERKERVKIYREKILLPIFNETNYAKGKYLEEIFVLFALYAHKQHISDDGKGKGTGKRGNKLYKTIIKDISRWVDVLKLDQEEHYSLLTDYMFRKEHFFNPDKDTYQYRFKDYLNEVFEPFRTNLILEDKKVLAKSDDAIDIDIVVEFYQLLNKYTESHDYISKSDLHRFKKLDNELTEFKRQIALRKEWLDLDQIFLEEKADLKRLKEQADMGLIKKSKDITGDYLPNLPREWVLDVVERKELSQKDYITFLEEIKNTNLSIHDVSKKTFQEFMTVLHEYKDVDKENELKFILGGEACTFDLNKWRKMIIHSKLQLTIEAYAKARGNDGHMIFFDEVHDHDNYDSIELTQITTGSFLFSGKSQIDGKFTKEAFENTVQPSVNEFLKFIEALDDKNIDDLKAKKKVEHYKIKSSTRRILHNLVKNAIHDYAEKYSDSMTRFASALKIKATSEADLKFVLQQMQKTSSTFGVFLKKLYANTTIKVEDSIYQPMVDELKKFKYIKAVMREEKGDLPELNAYYGILEMMEKELNGEFSLSPDNSLLPPDNQAPQKKITGADGLPMLSKQLSPMGKMTLNIFQRQSNSYYLRIKQWLDAVNMPNEAALRAPFYAPAISSYRLGAAELEKQVAMNWDLLLRKVLVPLSEHFPFDPKSHKVISPDEVTSLFGVGGTFWQYFESMLGPAAVLGDDKWHKTSVTSIVALPPSMLPTLNRLQRLKTTLWDKEGKNKALAMKVNAGLLPDAGVVYHIFNSLPVLAYMNAGSSSVLAFNQKPQWQDIKVEWWRPHIASIGIQFNTLDKDTSVFSAVNTGEQNWGILRLLAQGSETSDLGWIWNIDIDNAMQSVDNKGYAKLTANGPISKMPVRFRFDHSIQSIFDLNLSWNARKEIDLNLRNLYTPKWNKKPHGDIKDVNASPSPYHTPDQLKEIFGLPPKDNPFKVPDIKSEKDAVDGL